MKITYAIPKEKSIDAMRQFLKKEIAAARNIKDKKNNEQVAAGLSRMLEQAEPGMIYQWDGDAWLMVKALPYKGKETIYKCGREFVEPAPPQKSKYLLVVMDADECTIGLLNGKRIETLWHDTSNVPRKQGAGGQSKVRFARNRELALKHWYKEIADKMRDIVMKG
jgi:peptide subunit release factor 1 (eRF1)